MSIQIPATIQQSMAHLLTPQVVKLLNHPKAELRHGAILAPSDDPDDIPNIMYYNPLPKRLYSALIRANQ